MREKAMVVQANIVNFDCINVGDELPTLHKTETQETIDTYSRLIVNREPRAISSLNLHTDQEFANTGIFTGTVNYGVVTCAYMVELLQLAFPTQIVLKSSINMRALEPIRAGDTIAFTGKVLDKRQEVGKRLVDVEVAGTNQLGQTVAAAKVTIPM